MHTVVKERDITIDVARGIALLLMIIGHLGIKNGITQYIYSFHMPLFFMISGMTLKEISKWKDIKLNLIKRVKSLLIPYLFFGLAFCDGSYKSFLFILYGSRNALEAASSLTPLWFLTCLFTCSILFSCIIKLIGTNRPLLIILISFALATLGYVLVSKTSSRYGLPFNFDIAFCAMPFICLGWFWRNWCNEFLEKTITKKTYVVISLLLFILVFVLYRYNLPQSVSEGFNHVEMSIGSYGNIILFYVCAFIGSIAVVLAANISTNGILAQIGKCTMVCLGTHSTIISLTYDTLGVLGLNGYYKYALAFAIVCISILPLDKLFSLFAPNLIGKNTTQ